MLPISRVKFPPLPGMMPKHPGIYIAVGPNRRVLYVGKAADLASRWCAGGVHHHQYLALRRASCQELRYLKTWNGVFRLAVLANAEAEQIARYQPPLNARKEKGNAVGAFVSSTIDAAKIGSVLVLLIGGLAVLYAQKQTPGAPPAVAKSAAF